MKRLSFAAFLTLLVALSPCRLVTLSLLGQESPYAEDLRFVQELRSRGYSDLARKYLERLTKRAPAAMRQEFALEGALTELEEANGEPDSGKRIALYTQARAKFQQFLQANPKHPRAADAKFDIARATTLQGKAQLSRARLEGDMAARSAEGAKARATFTEAEKLLKQLPQTPQTQLALALNLLDQSETYLNRDKDKDTDESNKLVQQASKLLEPLAGGDTSNKITWIARAWSGRCLDLLDTSVKAREKYRSVTEATGGPVQDGKRLARYFTLLSLKEAPNPKQSLDDYRIKQAYDWLRDYPNYKHSPEGYGVEYLLAESLLRQSENAAVSPVERKNHAVNARKFLRDIERSDNEFTDRAKALKIAAMAKLGTFKAPIAKLTTFEDCFARAQFEQAEVAKDAKKFADDPKKADSSRKQHIDNIIQALQLGLKKPDAKVDPKNPSPEPHLARSMLTYYLWKEKKYKEAIEIGETFARKEPNVSQAPTVAIYALLAHGGLLAERESKAGDAGELKSDPIYKDEKEKMLAFARQMVRFWPRERAGDVARHEIASRLLRDEKTPEAIEELAAITPAYPSYISTQLVLARAALHLANQEKDKGDPKGYRRRALTALSALPEPQASADPQINSDYIQAKMLLALEWYKDKKYKEVDGVLGKLKPQVESWKLDYDVEKEKEKRSKYEDGRVQLLLYSTVMQANADFKAAKYKEVTRRLDPLVERFNADQLPQLKESEVGSGLIGLALRANVQLNNLERARVAVKALQLLQTEKGAEKNADNTTAILAQLVGLISQQIDELRKKDDKESLLKAQVGFTAILNEVAGGKKKPTAKLAYYLARCYAGMDEHKKAVDLLKPFAEEPPGAEASLHQAIQLLLVQEYRQAKETAEARKLLDEILKGKDGKGGWGTKKIDVQKSLVVQFEDEEKYTAAILLCDKYVKQLVRHLDDNKLKDYYFDFYYHLVYSLLKHAQGMSDASKKTAEIRKAAQRIVALEKAQGGFGGDESKKRFEELLEKEADLRQQYNALKGGK
jgi:hypothetical protein